MTTTAFTLKTAPTFEPVSLDALRTHVRASDDGESSSEDALIAACATAARQWVEGYTGRALATQTWQLSMSCLERYIWLPRAAPLTATDPITFVKYYDADNAQQTWNSSNYILPAFHEPALIEVLDTATWPSTYLRSDAWQIEYICGYAEGSCPEALQQAVLLLAGHWYENREDVLVGALSKHIEFGAEALCAPYRVWWREPSSCR